MEHLSFFVFVFGKTCVVKDILKWAKQGYSDIRGSTLL